MTAQAADATASSRRGFADLVARVKPAVISVRVQMQATAVSDEQDEQSGGPTIQPGSPMDRFFRQFGMPNGTQQTPRVQRNVEAEGSGFFISADGYAVTNNHVVDHAKTVQITTDDGRILPAKSSRDRPQRPTWRSSRSTAATSPLTKFADHEPRIGDWVITRWEIRSVSAAR